MDYFNYLIEKLATLIEVTTLKFLTTGAVAFVTFFFGSIYNEALLAILMLLVFDTILGIAASVFEGRGITSRRFGRSLIKGIVYFTAISAGYFADQTIPYALIESTMIAFIGVTEFISILENMGRLGYKTPKKLLNQLQDIQEGRLVSK